MSSSKSEVELKRSPQELTEKRNFWYKVFHAVVWVASHALYRFKVVGLERLPSGSAVICCNHSSNWDVVFLTVALGRKTPLIFTPKLTMRRIPLLGQMMNLIGVVWIDRSKPSDMTPLRRLMRNLGDGDKIVMFPEGHRLREGESESAKTGAIMLASRTGSPLVPVNIPARKRIFRVNTVTIGEPYTISAQGSLERHAKADELMRKIRSVE